MAILPGRRLGPYEILSAVGAGGMGEVYKARDTRLDRTVAIKVLPTHLADRAELRERFEREAKTIAGLNHPHICTLYDVGHQDGTDFLVMEYIEGETLAQRLVRGALPIQQVLQYSIEIADALDKAHRKGITHRDLKPGNIMLTKSGAKLLDFGLAKLKQEGAPANAQVSELPTLNEPLTEQGTILGTLQYMAPEQVEGKEVDARTDIFSFGAVVYEMAAGKKAFEGKSHASLIAKILETDPPPITSLQPMTPAALDRVVTRCMAKDPDDRWQTARDLEVELKWIAEGSSQVTQRAATPAPKKAARIIPWGIATLFALALGGLLFLGKQGKPDAQYTTVTYREGILEAARFSHDGQAIVYSGEWEGNPRQIAMYRVGSPESRDLGIPSATVASVSSSDQLAVLRNCEHIFVLDCGGTLATASLAAGSPRDLIGHVAYADWSPDGKQLVISKISAEGPTLEFPPGHVLYQQKAGWFGHPRFSPDGSMIAFENHPNISLDEGEIDVVDLNGKQRTLSKGGLSIEGLAWSANGKEVWFASNSPRAGWADSLRAVTLLGKERITLTLPSVRLHDIASDGRILLSREDWRFQLLGYFPGDKGEHPYSWLDAASPTAISADGKTLSFFEAGEVWAVAGEEQCYFRSTDGAAPVSLGAGESIISPDGKWILFTSLNSRKMMLQPVGLGEPKELPTAGLVEFENASWSDDGRFIAYEAQTTQSEWNAYVQPIAGGPPVLIRSGARNSYPKLSPDGSMAALRGDRGGISLYRTNGSQLVALQKSGESEYPVRFADGGKSLLVAEGNGHELVLTRVDLAHGHRTPWRRFETDQWDGSEIVVTPDLKYYAYQAPRYSSVLYIVENVR
jgi:serine/threonine protein kinase/Tol biopolymer transport system component